MIRAVAGVLERRPGAAGAGIEAVLRAAVEREGLGEATTVRRGALVVACTGAAPMLEGDALCVLDGVLDVPVPCGPDTPAPEAEAAVLTAWRAGGDAALAALRGDFALVLWDGRRGALARDHFGLRGMCHADDGTVLRFASEPHLVARLLPATPGPDPYGLAHWLAISAPPGDRTLLDGVRRVPPAGVVDLELDGPRAPRRHWEPRHDATRLQGIGVPEAGALVREALSTAVRRRSRGPQETAVLLSGGLDSGSVAGIARGTLGAGQAPARAYSAVFPCHRTVDESTLIGRLWEALDLEGVTAAVHTPAVLPGVLPFVERFGLPPVSPNLFFWNPLHERAVADGTRVLLDGEGGDELYGLSPYLLSDRLRAGRVRAAADLVHRIPGADRGVSRATVRRWLVGTGLEGLAPAWVHGLSRRMRRNRSRPVDWLGPAVAAAFDETAPGGAWKRLDGPRWWAFLVHAVTQIGPSLAYDHGRRRAAMAGLMPRHPLIDIDCLELILSLPPELAFDPSRSRPVLREAVRGLIPDEVRLRPAKSTFDQVFHESLAVREIHLVRALLGAGARVEAHVDRDALSRLTSADPPPAGGERQMWALNVWRLLTAECFLRHLEDPAEPRRTLEALGLVVPDVRVAVSTR